MSLNRTVTVDLHDAVSASMALRATASEIEADAARSTSEDVPKILREHAAGLRRVADALYVTKERT